MKDFEDMQEKYKDKGKITPKSIPLAADAAHLLSEYLDSLTIQLVISGLDEPYRITKEYEEMFVQELQKRAGSAKLTYEVVSSMFEQYGTPTQVVKKYIEEHNPKLIEIVPKIKSLSRKRSRSKPRKILLTISFVLIFMLTFISLLTSEIDFFIVALLMTIIVITARTLEILKNDWAAFDLVLARKMYLTISIALIFILSFVSIFSFVPNGTRIYPEPLITALFIFIIAEILTGLFDNPFQDEHYEILRQSSIFFLTLESMIFSWAGFDIGTYEAIFDQWGIILLAWSSMMIIVFIKDHTDFLKTTNSNPKPLARFILPSYLAFGISLVLGSISLLLDANRNYPNEGEFTLFMFAFFFAALSLVLEIRKKYPLSLKKFGYTLFLFFMLPIYFFSYQEERHYEFGFDLEFMANTESIILSLSLWVITVVFLIPILFRSQIKEQLQAFRSND